MDILCSMILIMDCLGGPKMLDDALMWKLVVALNVIII
jgi:hypothetical protein